MTTPGLWDDIDPLSLPANVTVSPFITFYWTSCVFLWPFSPEDLSPARLAFTAPLTAPCLEFVSRGVVSFYLSYCSKSALTCALRCPIWSALVSKQMSHMQNCKHVIICVCVFVNEGMHLCMLKYHIQCGPTANPPQWLCCMMLWS